MGKVQAYPSDEVCEKINAIVEKRRMEGAKDKDVSFSSISTMLLELGLRVYEAQMERKESGFNQRHCCKVSDEAAFCLIQRPYISKTLLTRRISPRGSP